MSNPSSNSMEIKELNDRLNDAHKKEEDYWRKISRQLWLSLGDKNSEFFHAVTRGRRAINKIATLENIEGRVFHEESEILSTIVDYFKDLFSSQDCPSLEALDGVMFSGITTEMNNNLIVEPTLEEVRSAVFSIHPDKAPGPDGFSASFL